jgi:serine protease Do
MRGLLRTPRLLVLMLVLVLGLTLAGGGLIGGAVAARAAASTARPASQATTLAAPAAATPAGTTAAPAGTFPDVAGVADKVRPATVLVLNIAQGRGGAGRQAGQGTAGGDVPQGAGTGFIVDSNGLIVTNNHVVAGAQKLTVTLPPPDGRSFDARLLGTDAQTDLAVLKIEASNLPTAPLGDSAALRVGDWVVAIGNALALEGGPTVTAGVVSATGRDAQEPGGTGTAQSAGPTLYDLIQTDAAINPGNSGGPLVNLRGEVVGINTLGATDAQGIGFAISIDGAKPIIQTLSQGGAVTRAYLGVQVESVTPSVAAAQGLARTDGVVIGQVVAGTPAAQAGLQPGDVIVGIGDVTVKSQQDLQGALTSTFKPGDTVEVKFNRGGADRTVRVTLGTKPAS